LSSIYTFCLRSDSLDAYAHHLVGGDAEDDEVIVPEVLPPHLLVLRPAIGGPAVGCLELVLTWEIDYGMR
jgi:hypothetical protein